MKLKSLLIVPLLVTSLQAASVDDLTFILINGDTEYSVSDCSESASGSLVIPSTYGGKPVTEIGFQAFQDCKSLSSITILGSVTSIAPEAFRYCSVLTSITIPDSVTSIGDEAFVGCFSMTSITIPDSITSIGNRTFFNCSLSSITIPDSVTSIGDSAFGGCDGLSSITIPDSVTSIGDEAFSFCSSLVSITFEGDAPLQIGTGVFESIDTFAFIQIEPDATGFSSPTWQGINTGYPKIIYVNANAPSGGDGTSWETAFNYLQDGLDVTAKGAGDQVWIAQGTYYPDDGNNVTQGNRLESFYIKDQVELHGGFGGFENAIQERDLGTYTTVLSGEIYADQIYWSIHISTIENHATFNGLTITKGTANGYGTDEDESAAVYGAVGTGSGTGNITATNCTFSENSATYGGVACYGTWNVINCNFIDNSASILGGVVRNGSWNVINSDFIGNSANSDGGVVSNSTWNVINSNFIGNSASYTGGVAAYTDVTASNCVFSNNTSNSGGVAYYGDWTVSSCTFSDNTADQGMVARASTWIILNSVVYGNGGSRCYFYDMVSLRNMLETALTPLTVRSYNIMEGGPNWLNGTTDYTFLINGTSDLGDGSYVIRDSPLFVDASDPNGQDDIWGTEDDGLRLQINSPAIGIGDMGFLKEDTDDIDYDSDTLELIPIDIAGYERVQEGTLDLGAYEYGDLINTGPDTDGDGIFDVSDTDDDNDGLSDTEELSLGTNPLLRDSNGNGVSDLRESYDNLINNPSGTYDADDLSDSRLAGQSDVTSEPNLFSLYTLAQVSSANAAGRTQGQNDVTSDPNSFSLYSVSELSAAQTNSRSLGQQDVVTSPLSYGLYSPSYVISLLDSSRTVGQSDVTSDPSSYGLYSEQGITDLRAGSTILQFGTNNSATLELQIERSHDLSNWTTNTDDLVEVEIPLNGDTEFFRFKMTE